MKRVPTTHPSGAVGCRFPRRQRPCKRPRTEKHHRHEHNETLLYLLIFQTIKFHLTNLKTGLICDVQFKAQRAAALVHAGSPPTASPPHSSAE